MTYSNPLVQCQSALPFWDTAIHGQGHVCGQKSRSHLTLKIQRSWSWSNPLVTFEAWSSIDMFAFCFVAISPHHFWLRYSKFHISPWKFKVMAKVKPGGHIWGLKFNRYVCLSFRGNRTFFHIWPWKFKVKVTTKIHQNLSNQVIYRSGPTIMPNMKEIQNAVQKLSREQEFAAGVQTGTKTKSWLNNFQIDVKDRCQG